MITVYTEHITPRLEYILSEMLQRRLGVKYTVTQNATDFAQATGLKINYSHTPMEADIHMVPHGLLSDNNIKPIDVSVTKNQQWHYTFWKTTEQKIPFDVFAAAFYLLSRYEEYTCTERDKHGRFEAKNSLAFTHQFLTTPLVDAWCEQLKQVWQSINPDLIFNPPTYQNQVTIDVDLAYEYYGIATWKWVGKLTKHILRLDFTSLNTAIKSRFNPKHDPFNTYDFINQHTQNSAGYFVLMNDEGGHDRNINPTGKVLKKLIGTLQQKSAFVGVHPSYASNQNNQKLTKEIDQLSGITHQPITHSRQHFLKLNLPQTYEQLLAANIKLDYTLFYAEEPGFRASTCVPFLFYDLKNEQTTTLLLMPTCLMDTTITHYLHQSNRDWYSVIVSLKQTTKQYGGVFITLWHNNTVATTKVKPLFLETVKE